MYNEALFSRPNFFSYSGAIRSHSVELLKDKCWNRGKEDNLI